MDQDQLKALKAVLGTSAVKIAAHFSVSLPQCETFQSELVAMIRADISALTRKPIAFLLDLKARSGAGAKFDASVVARGAAAGKNVVHLSWDLKFIKSESLAGLNLAKCSEISNSGSTFALYIEGRAAYELIDGRTVSQFDIQSPQTPLGTKGQYQRSIQDFDQILKDHNDSRLRMEKGARYWHDKSSRILLTGPDGTEAIFHHDLCWWLQENVLDQLDVYKEPSSHGLDKTDIVVVTSFGSRVIEVKWMGENQSKTRYGKAVINQGLIQLKKYLERDRKYVWGHLVIYDGRDEASHAKESSFDPVHKHTACDDPAIVFLESEVPSLTAKTIVAAQARKARSKKKGKLK